MVSLCLHRADLLVGAAAAGASAAGADLVVGADGARAAAAPTT